MIQKKNGNPKKKKGGPTLQTIWTWDSYLLHETKRMTEASEQKDIYTRIIQQLSRKRRTTKEKERTIIKEFESGQPDEAVLADASMRRDEVKKKQASKKNPQGERSG